MLKKILCILLGMLILTGCAVTAPTEPTEGSTPGATVSENYLENVKAAANVIRYDAEPLIEYDPNREVYISMSNQDYVYYPDCTLNGNVAIIITREHYDVSDIQVNIPMQTEYQVRISDLTESCTVASYNSKEPGFGLQLYQYIAMQEVGWQEICEMQAYANAAMLLMRQNTGNPQEYQAYEAIYKEYSDSYQNILAKYEEEFKSLPQEKIPQFSAYHVSIDYFGAPPQTETVTEVEFIIGGKSYIQKVGKWTMHDTLPKELYDPDNQNIGLKQEDISRGAITSSPYLGEYLYLNETITFKAQEDLTITGIRQMGTQVNLLGAEVSVSGQARRFWEMDQPIEVEKGDRVAMDLYVKDDRFSEYEVCLCTYFIMDYQIRNKSCSMVMSCGMLRIHMDVWDTYLMAFEGIDIGEYYTCYFDPMQHIWLKNMPQSWKEK